MSIITLKKNSQAKHCRNHSNGPDGFSIWPSINSGLYNGSRIIPGFSSVQTPFRGNSPIGVSYMDRYGRGGYKYIISKPILNCPYPAHVCKKENKTVLNNSALLSNKLMGTKFGTINTVKDFSNNVTQSEYIITKINNTNSCYYNSISNDLIFKNIPCNLNQEDNYCKSKNGILPNYQKSGSLAKQSIDYSEYNHGKLIIKNCLQTHNKELFANS